MATPDALLVELIHTLRDSCQRALQYNTLERPVLCWMVFFWRAIAVNGMPMMHLQKLRAVCPPLILALAWRLLTVRVWAAASECARFFDRDVHPALYESVMSGRPSFMPGWARRGMPIPFIFDIMYIVGIQFADDMTMAASASAYHVYHACFEAILGRTTVDTAFINHDPFLVRTLGLPNASSELQRLAMHEYTKLTEHCAVGMNFDYSRLEHKAYAHLLQVLQVFLAFDDAVVFRSIYRLHQEGRIPTVLQWDQFAV